VPAYRFESRRGSSTEVVEGVQLEDDEAAKTEALAAAKDALIDGILEGVDETDWVTRVYDEAGYLIATVAYADILQGEYPDDAKSEPPEGPEPGVMRSG
jgi:hypothetical protein